MTAEGRWLEGGPHYEDIDALRDDIHAVIDAMQDMAQSMLSAQSTLSMVGKSAYWTDGEMVAKALEQLAWGLERWESTALLPQPDAAEPTAQSGEQARSRDTDPQDGVER